ncbi:MAG: SEC-C domain-containing protein [Deltaproteobacteria bacterium]|nr:SEC-C domain-containing protein [Deltaproteobacteria bacterium]
MLDRLRQLDDEPGHVGSRDDADGAQRRTGERGEGNKSECEGYSQEAGCGTRKERREPDGSDGASHAIGNGSLQRLLFTAHGPRLTHIPLALLTRGQKRGDLAFHLALGNDPEVGPMKAGRNDPCPCGSGRKFKKCCAVESQGDDLARHRLRRAEGTVVEQVLAFAKQHYRVGVLKQAWHEFNPEADDAFGDDPMFETSFIPWFLFNWLPDPELALTPAEPVDVPLALQYLASPDCRLDEFDQRFARLICERPYSFYTVTAVEPGQSMTLTDIFTSSTTLVLEHSASLSIRAGAILYTRFVEMDGAAVMSGCAPLVIPPDFRLRLIDLRDALTKIDGVLTDAHLHVLDPQLRAVYLDIADELNHPRLPKLCNTDGDPLVPTTLHFDLRCSSQEAFDALRTLGLEELVENCLQDAKQDASGALHSVRFDWSKRGNRQMKDWDNTTLGNLHIDGPRLTVNVNSERRAKKIRKEIEQRLGEKVLFQRALIESIEAQLEAKRGRPETAKERHARQENERLNALPEVQEKMREMAAARWRSWLHEKIPALNNRTPRQASRTAQGRERLEALLQQFEWSAERAGHQPFAPDVAALRAELGLADLKREA